MARPETSRYGYCCPNSPYREYVRARPQRVIRYCFEGIFLIATFWPVVCYCKHCQRRFMEATAVRYRLSSTGRIPTGELKGSETWLCRVRITSPAPSARSRQTPRATPGVHLSAYLRFFVTERLAAKNDHQAATTATPTRLCRANCSTTQPQPAPGIHDELFYQPANHTAKRARSCCRLRLPLAWRTARRSCL